MRSEESHILRNKWHFSTLIPSIYILVWGPPGERTHALFEIGEIFHLFITHVYKRHHNILYVLDKWWCLNRRPPFQPSYLSASSLTAANISKCLVNTKMAQLNIFHHSFWTIGYIRDLWAWTSRMCSISHCAETQKLSRTFFCIQSQKKKEKLISRRICSPLGSKLYMTSI